MKKKQKKQEAQISSLTC